jgi:hypothetical protein
MNPMYAQHHDGVEEAAAIAALGTAENAQAPVHSLEIWEEGRHPAPPSPSFLIQINEEENQLDHTGTFLSIGKIGYLPKSSLVLDYLPKVDGPLAKYPLGT